MKKGECDMVVDWIWRLCNIDFKSVVMPEDWRTALNVPLYKGKGERIKGRNYESISLLSVFRKNIYRDISRQS